MVAVDMTDGCGDGIGSGTTHSGLRLRGAHSRAPARRPDRHRSTGTHPAPPNPEGNIVNTSSLTAGSTQQRQATALRAQARQLNERLARRAGFALLAWSRRQDARRTNDAVLLRRQTEQLATEARNDQFRQLALRGAALV
jgi:hypothetical protein